MVTSIRFLGKLSVEEDTAIKRKSLSPPADFLKDKIVQPSLDYGCGYGFDANHLGMTGWDPIYEPCFPYGLYNTIFCTYVLDVIKSKIERLEILKSIQSLLSKDGIAYISVRRNCKDAFSVRLKLQSLVRNNEFETYILKKGSRVC